jgi:hypothetical protein
VAEEAEKCYDEPPGGRLKKSGLKERIKEC